MSEKYFEKENFKLLLGDTLEILRKMESNSIDLIITSPPYNLNMKKRKDTGVAQYDVYDDNLSYEDYIKWQKDILNECFRVLKRSGQLFYNHKERYLEGYYFNPYTIIEKSKFKMKQTIIWNRGTTTNYINVFGCSYEYIYWMYKDENCKPKTSHTQLKSVWNINKEENNYHPAPYPLEIPTRIIYSIFDNQKNKKVLDIFNGSGTTGISANLLGHSYIGIDISKNYLKDTIKRFENKDKEKEKVIEEISLHFVKGKYKGPIAKNQIDIFDFLDEGGE